MYFSISTSAPSTSYSTASPMDIPSSGTKSSSPSCAFPSWPRRASLSSNSSADEEYHNHSFIISDEELFPSVFDDAEKDISPFATPSSHTSRSPASPMCEPHIVADHGTLMRELIAEEKAKMEKRERRRRRSANARKARSGSDSSKRMSPIQESGE